MRFDQVIQKYGYPVASKAVSRKVSDARKGSPYAMKYFENTAVDWAGNHSKFNCPKWKFLIDAPFPVSHKCCDIMKKKPFKLYENQRNRKPIIGTMAAESTLREKAWQKTGCNAFDSKKPKSQPLSFWTQQDILHYIKQFDVPYCPIYGEIRIKQRDGEAEGQMNLIDYLGCYETEDILETTGLNRTGCMFCAFGCHLEREPNRFQRMRVTHPKQYAYCIGGGEYVDGIWQPSKEGLGMGKVLDYIHVKY